MIDFEMRPSMTIEFHHEVLGEGSGSERVYCGETWAEAASEELGHVKWHADGHTVSIDYIETNGGCPLLGVRLLKTLLDIERQNLDPGLMNDAGKRLWQLFRARYSYS